MPISEQQQQPRLTLDHLVLGPKYTKSGEARSHVGESETCNLLSKVEQVLKSLQRLQVIKNKPSTCQCQICLNKLRDMSSIDCCDHLFCFECIEMWTISSTKCPACEKKIRKIFYGEYGQTKYIRDFDVGEYYQCRSCESIGGECFCMPSSSDSE